METPFYPSVQFAYLVGNSDYSMTKTGENSSSQLFQNMHQTKQDIAEFEKIMLSIGMRKENILILPLNPSKKQLEELII